jgi:hypothetical protein
MSTVRSTLRTRIRDYLDEATANIWSNTQLDTFITEEVNSLPSKDIYLEEIWSTTLVKDQYDYTLPSGTIKIEKLERNDGTTALPEWNELKGWDSYAGTLYLNWRPSAADTIRALLKKSFTAPTDDTTALDVPDDKCEVVVWGVVIRAYRRLIGYLRGSQSWDTVTKPSDLQITVIQNWLRDAKQHYHDLIQQYMTVPRPKEIDMCS